jgi:hypothetical protein
MEKERHTQNYACEMRLRGGGKGKEQRRYKI